MLTLPTNTTNFFWRIFFLLLTFFLFYLFFNFGLRDPGGQRVLFSIKSLHFDFLLKYVIYFILCVVVYLFVLLVISLLAVNKVQVDTISDTIKFNSLFNSKTIATSEIVKFSETTHRNQAKVFNGLLLEFCDGKKVQVVGQNVHRVSDLKDYLHRKQVPQGKGQKMKFPFN